MVRNGVSIALLSIFGCVPIGAVSTAFMAPLSEEAPGCEDLRLRRPTRWATSSEDMMIIAGPEVRGWTLYEPYPAPEVFATVVVFACVREGYPTGTLTIVPQADDHGVEREAFAIELVERSQNAVRVVASNERRKFMICVQGSPSDDFGGLKKEAETILGVAGE